MKGPAAQARGALPQFTEADITALNRIIMESPKISGWNKVNARGALQKLFQDGPRVLEPNEISVLGRVFGPEATQAIAAARNAPAGTGSWWSLAGRAAGSQLKQEAVVMRAAMASMDLSAPRQMAPAMAAYPKEGFQAFIQGFRHVPSEAATDALRSHIQSRPTFELMERARLALTALESGAGGHEEVFLGRFAQSIFGKGAKRLPGGRWLVKIADKVLEVSDRAFTGALTKLRADLFDRLLRDATRAGVNVEDDRFLLTLGEIVNTVSGRGNLGKLQGAMDAVGDAFFAPRLMASRVQWANPNFWRRMWQYPTTRNAALRSVLAYTTAMVGTAFAASQVGFDVNFTSTDPRFLTIGVPGTKTRVGVPGAFRPYVVLIAREMLGRTTSATSGKTRRLGEYGVPNRFDLALRFLAGKFAPLYSLVYEGVTGRTYTGEKFSLPRAVADRYTPIVLQDLREMWQDSGGRALLVNLLGFFGWDVQTYNAPPQQRRQRWP